MLFILALYWCIDLISLPELLGLTKTREFLCILLLILQHSNSVCIDLIYLPDLLGLTETRVPLTRLKCRYLSLPKKKKKVKVSVDLVRHAETCGKQQQCLYTLHDVKQRVEIIIKTSGRTWWMKPLAWAPVSVSDWAGTAAMVDFAREASNILQKWCNDWTGWCSSSIHGLTWIRTGIAATTKPPLGSLADREIRKSLHPF